MAAPGAALMIGISGLLSSVPVFLIFLDYHKKENRHKAVLFVAFFFALLLLFSIFLLPFFSFYIVLVVPVLLFIYLVIARKN